MILRTLRSLLLLLFMSSMTAFAQYQPWQHIRNDETIYSNVNCIAENADGTIYLGTPEGLVSYHGRHFQLVPVIAHQQKAVNPYVLNMSHDMSGKLWVATRSHVYTYERSTGRVHLIDLGNFGSGISLMAMNARTQRLYLSWANLLYTYKMTDTGLSLIAHSDLAGPLNKLLAGNDGYLYAVRDGKELIRTEGRSATVLYTAERLKDIGLLRDKNAIAMLTAEGLQIIELQHGTLSICNSEKRWDLSTDITRISVLANSDILVHNTDGIYLASPPYHRLVHFTHDEKNARSIQNDLVTASFCDRRGNLWIAEEGTGISVLPRRARNISYIPSQAVGGGRIWRFYYDSAHQRTLTSSEHGVCILQHDSGALRYTAQLRPPGATLFDVREMIWWGEHTILMLTNSQGAWTFNTGNNAFQPYQDINRSHLPTSMLGMYEYSRGRYLIYGIAAMFWYTPGDGKIQEITRHDSIAGRATSSKGAFRAYCICRDMRQHMWIGSGTGICLLDSNLNVIKNYGGRTDGHNDGLGNNVILDIKQTATGEIYAATMGAGLYRLTANDTFARVPLTADITIIYCIELIDGQHMLLSTSKGLCWYDIRNGVSKLLNENNGFPLTDHNQCALYNNGRYIYAAGTRGIAVLDKASLDTAFADSARLLALVGSLPVTEIVLPKGRRTLDVDLAIAGYPTATEWQLEYKLDGSDDHWNTLARDEWHIHYNSIAPGNYTLLIRARDEQGVFQVAQEMVAISALPFFWETSWFRVTAFCFLITLIIVVVRFFSRLSLKWKLKKLEDEQKIAKERLRISRELHDNVGSQITYLITGLESSGMLLDRKDMDNLGKKLTTLRTSARESMQQLRDAIWALNSESVMASVLLDRFKTWTEKLIAEFPHMTLTIESNIQEDTLLDPIKSLNLFRMMQEAVHNALKHSSATQLAISYYCEGTELRINISDNGKGYDTGARAGVGMQAMAARAREMGADIEVGAARNAGTRVAIVLPIK